MTEADPTALSGKLALVTGGGRGIGRAIALELARRGANVLINYVRHPDDAEQTALAVRALGVESGILRGNVADETHVGRMFDSRAVTAKVETLYLEIAGLRHKDASGV